MNKLFKIVGKLNYLVIFAETFDHHETLDKPGRRNHEHLLG
jgi:hypothetical protein